MNEGVKSFFNGNSAIYFRIVSLSFQGLIIAGMFWIGGTFERKSDFDAYKADQDAKRMEEYKTMSQISETMARLDERLKSQMEKK